jgi:histidinol phosphatase-like PHP family hydrolase
MKIDFHVHTSERSACATAPAAEQIKKAIAAGLNGIAITDHHHLVHPLELIKYNQIYAPFKIFGGIEITAESEDWLVLGLSEPNLESENWSYADLQRYVRSKGGIIILAHPYRYRQHISVDLSANPPDAIEIRSNNIRIENVPRILQLASQLHLPTVCNSDAHSTSNLGRYFNIFSIETPSRNLIFNALRTGALQHSVN